MINHKQLVFALLIVSLLITVVLALATTSTAATVSNSPIPAYCGGLIAVPAEKPLLEARYIYSRAHDDHLTGFCWQIGNESTSQETFSQFCEIVKWADPTAHCSPGPASIGALKLVYLTWLPVARK